MPTDARPVVRSLVRLGVAFAAIVFASGCSGSQGGGAHSPSGPDGASHDPAAFVGPGTHAFDLAGLRITLDAPRDWGSANGYILLLERGAGDPPAALFFWIVDDVFPRPCRADDRRLPDVGPTVDDFIAAVERQPGRSSEPEDVEVDGYPGKLIQLRVPLGIDVDACWDGRFLRWTADEAFQPGGGRYNQGAGQSDRLWVVDVDGVRLVIDASFFRRTSPADRDELWQIVDSIQIG